MRQGVTEERHAAKHHEAAEDGANDSDDERGGEGPLHKRQSEGVGEPVHQRGPPCGS